MYCNFFQLYFLEEKGYFLSPNPHWDWVYWQQKGYNKLTILTPPAPLILAEKYLWQAKWLPKFLSKFPQKEIITQPEVGIKKEVIAQAEQVLAGRCLLEGEVEKALNFCSNWQEIAHLLCLQGKGRWQRAYSKHCFRCGSSKEEKMSCHYAQLSCSFCGACLTMGQARSCSILYTFFPLVNNKPLPISFHLSFALTPAQARASAKLVQFLFSKEKRCLLWAVCGAGKTEIVYAAIAQALAQGQKVLLAIPRQEVVRELYPRLEKAFPKISIACLYGGKKDKYQAAQLTIATTHQTLRFYQNFPLVILDEVDAYPYKDNQMLYYALERAASGKIIYLTATPEVNLRGLPTITIPARHHGYPLPEPELLRISLPKKKGLPDKVLQMLEASIEKDKCQVFLFLPTIQLTEEIGKWLQNYYQGKDWVQYSHSKDRAREKKKKSFVAGDFPLLVTTTIMERGVTIDRLHVFVLYSDQEHIFSTPTLIQIAGRAGRKKEHPLGKVFFISEKISTAMREAKRIITAFNQEAQEKGYLRKMF